MSDGTYWLERAKRLKQENIALDNELKELKEANRTLVYKVRRFQEELGKCS